MVLCIIINKGTHFRNFVIVKISNLIKRGMSQIIMKFIIISIKKNVLPIIFILFTICLIVFSKGNLTATKNGLTLWATCVVPALFPFFVVTNVLTQTKVVSFIGRLLDKFMRPLFNVPGVRRFL